MAVRPTWGRIRDRSYLRSIGSRVRAPFNRRKTIMLNGKQRKWLRGMAHDLQPVLQIGQHGLTDAVVAEAEQQLSVHELIKVRMRGVEDGKAMGQDLASKLNAELCGAIGHTAILYRPNPDAPKITLPR